MQRTFQPTRRRCGHLINRRSCRKYWREATRPAHLSHLEMNLTAAQWSLLSPLLNGDSQKRRGRPAQDIRGTIEGIFWVLRTGARWADLPDRYPSHQTCHRRFMQWLQDGTLFACFRLLAEDLRRKDTPGSTEMTAAMRTRSWKWNTALLLQSPLACKALGRDLSVQGGQ
jgi:transposase